MKINEAAELINYPGFPKEKNQVWTELGCGTGTFTLALASLLPHGSTIFAVDKEITDLNEIPNDYRNAVIIKMHEDFVTGNMPGNVDGILMANSLHFVNDKNSFIKRISASLKRKGCFVIVDYDIDSANPWVPYPVNFNSLKNLFAQSGFNSVEKILERESVYQRGKMYSAVVKS